ncbi:MAG TPA: carbohydrate kinase family protein [Steroidobacteraceae bacterium]|nr:carbohydrate kinase family protein [Steroidobacteraceae bacterium]
MTHPTIEPSRRRVLICGSVAFDTIMVFEDHFSRHILPEKIHILNVSFLVPQLRREFGGCAGNIAYNLKLLGDVAYPMATVGRDFGPYREWMARVGVPADYVKVLESEHTAQAFITTDLDDNQITAFHPGAMQQSHLNRVPDAAEIGMGIVAPDGRQGMLEHAEQFAAARIPFIFDPGQGLPLFDGEELRRFIERSSWVAMNDYEWQLVQQKTGWSVKDVTRRVQALIVTRGAQGSVIYTEREQIEIACVKAKAVVDPTGCGDAYRAGIIHGLMHGLDLRRAGQIASVLGAIKIEYLGTQNHRFTSAELKQRLEQSFGGVASP